MSTITGGDKFKVLLAQVLFPKPDVLFLDEPTNNQDMETIAWLENELKRHDGTMIVISHDRHFLNGVVTHILDLDFQNIREFTGTYDDWYIAANLIATQAQADHGKAMREKEELEKLLNMNVEFVDLEHLMNSSGRITLVENIRFWKEKETDNQRE